jgi:Thiamine pyrophosphate enzyme, central domain
MTSIPATELWRRFARAARIDAIYGDPSDLFEVVPVPAAVAQTFAAAHVRVHGRRAAVHAGPGVVIFPAARRGPRRVFDAGSSDALAAAVGELDGSGEFELRVDLRPDQPVDDVVLPSAPLEEAWVEPDPEAIAALRSATSAVVLAGPGVIDHGAVPGLHDLAVAAGLGVLNTWGAKGVFHWRSQHHLATVGLQAEDFVLAGLAEVDLIIATGVDRAESPDRRWQLAPTLTLAPAALAPLAEHAASARRLPDVPRLRALLADVTQRGWSSEGVPIAPSRATSHYGECIAAGGLIAADAGLAGYWVARTLGTSRLGAVIVPSTRWPGFAAACVAVAVLRHPNQPALAVIDGPTDTATAAIVEAAAALGIRVPVEVWDPDGERLDAEMHRQRLRGLLFGRFEEGPSTLATDPRQLGEMIDAAGPVVAWT